MFSLKFITMLLCFVFVNSKDFEDLENVSCAIDIFVWLRIPIIGGKELDLCRLFIEVTSRGGFEKVRNVNI